MLNIYNQPISSPLWNLYHFCCCNCHKIFSISPLLHAVLSDPERIHLVFIQTKIGTNPPLNSLQTMFYLSHIAQRILQIDICTSKHQSVYYSHGLSQVYENVNMVHKNKRSLKPSKKCCSYNTLECLNDLYIFISY